MCNQEPKPAKNEKKAREPGPPAIASPVFPPFAQARLWRREGKRRGNSTPCPFPPSLISPRPSRLSQGGRKKGGEGQRLKQVGLDHELIPVSARTRRKRGGKKNTALN